MRVSGWEAGQREKVPHCGYCTFTFILTSNRLTEQLWQKLNIYESLLIDSLPELNSNQQSAIHRAILLVRNTTFLRFLEAYCYCSLQVHRTLMSLVLQSLELTLTVAMTVTTVNLQLQVLAQWGQQTT